MLRDIPSLPMLFFLPAIFTAAILFGRAYGLLAVALSTALADYFFLPPIYSFPITSSLAGLSLALFVAVGLFVALMGSALRDAYCDADGLQRRTAALHREAEEARLRAGAGERDRQLQLIEFGHRVKNDMQRITSSLQLRALHAGPEVAAVLKEAAN